MDDLERLGVPQNCPRCSAPRRGARGLHHNSKSAWCLGCGWSRDLAARSTTLAAIDRALCVWLGEPK